MYVYIYISCKEIALIALQRSHHSGEPSFKLTKCRDPSEPQKYASPPIQNLFSPLYLYLNDQKLLPRSSPCHTLFRGTSSRWYPVKWNPRFCSVQVLSIFSLLSMRNFEFKSSRWLPSFHPAYSWSMSGSFCVDRGDVNTPTISI